MKTMTQPNDIGSQLVILTSCIAMALWDQLLKYFQVFGVIGGTISVLLGLSLGLARTIDLINTKYDGSPKKYLTNAFKLKKSQKRRKNGSIL